MSHSCIANLILGYEFSINHREFDKQFQRFDSITGKPKLVSETSFDFKLKFMDLNLPFSAPDEMRSESKNRYSFEEWMYYQIDIQLKEYFKANDISFYEYDDDEKYDRPVIYKFHQFDDHLYYGVKIVTANSNDGPADNFVRSKSVSLKDYDDALKLFNTHSINFLQAFGLHLPIEPSLIVTV